MEEGRGEERGGGGRRGRRKEREDIKTFSLDYVSNL